MVVAAWVILWIIVYVHEGKPLGMFLWPKAWVVTVGLLLEPMGPGPPLETFCCFWHLWRGVLSGGHIGHLTALGFLPSLQRLLGHKNPRRTPEVALDSYLAH